jgi:glycosyltransferase involved in cell wall biosynthesis
MNNNKILILLAYYNRPEMIVNALNSIKNQDYKNWELAFVDDGSEVPGAPIARKILKDHLEKIKFYNTNNTREDKVNQGGSIFGKYWNEAMYSSDADIAIMLCDDDALYPEYLKKLNEYYLNNNVEYSYGNVSLFNPSIEKGIDNLANNLDTFLNLHHGPIVPYNNVDASQVSWKIETIKRFNIKFAYPKTADLDADLYSQLYNCLGYCHYNGIITQYKGWHDDQLGNRKLVAPYEVKDK